MGLMGVFGSMPTTAAGVIGSTARQSNIGYEPAEFANDFSEYIEKMLGIFSSPLQ